MPRKSAAELAITPVASLADSRARPSPPKNLGTEEGEVWRQVVQSMPAGWFRRSQFPMLRDYCRHAVAAERFGTLVNRVTPEQLNTDEALKDLDRMSRLADRHSRQALALARSMRLTHQSQVTPKKAGAAANRSREIEIDWSELRDG